MEVERMRRVRSDRSLIPCRTDGIGRVFNARLTAVCSLMGSVRALGESWTGYKGAPKIDRIQGMSVGPLEERRPTVDAHLPGMRRTRAVRGATGPAV